MSAGTTTPHWKSIAITFSVAYPTVQALTRLVAPHLGFLPRWSADALMVLAMCTVLSYVLPVANRALARWLRA